MLLDTDDLSLLFLVSVLAGYQLATFAEKVGKARGKFKVEPPDVTGDKGFDRVFRAQQNGLEYFTMFLVVLWTAGIFFHQIPAAIVGLVYIYARSTYFEGYTRSTKDRLPGFYLMAQSLRLLFGIAVFGLCHSFLRQFLGINLRAMIGF